MWSFLFHKSDFQGIAIVTLRRCFKMERASNQAQIIPNVQYSSMLLVTILASIGFCFAIVKVLPVSPNTGWDDDGRNFTYAIMQLCLSCVFFYLIVCAVWTIKNRETLHRRQLVFWPMRCRHCARAVGLISEQSSGQSTGDPRETSLRYMTRRRSLPILHSTCSIGKKSLESIMSNDEQIAQNVNDISSITQSVSGNLEALAQMESFRSPTSDIEVENTSLLKSFAYKRPHKSLLVLYNVFGTIALLTVPLKIFGVIICLTESHASEAPMKLNFNLVCEGVFDLLVSIGLACNLAFFNIFYDAVFLQTGIFPIFIGAYLASGLGLLALNLVYPLGVVVEPSHDPLLFSCELPKSFIEFMYNNALLVTPLYTDIGLIGVSILWKIWVSILPQSCLKVTSSDETDFEHFHRPFRISIRAYIKTLIQSLKKLIRRRRKYFGVCHILLLSLISVATFFLFDRFVVSRKSFNLSEITRTYVLWFGNMIGLLPFIALYRYQLFVSGNLETFRLKNNISFQHGLVGSHDVILIIGCSGMFMANVFRLVASAGILFGHDGPLPTDLLSLECFGLIYYLLQIYVVSSTTSFLLIIQRKRIISEAELKFVRICLMYTIFFNAGDWLTSVVYVWLWKDLTLYYGPVVGTMIGRFMQPLVYLYYLHTALLAYETYRDINGNRRGFRTNSEPSLYTLNQSLQVLRPL